MDFWRPRSIDTLRFTILRRVFLVLAVIALLCYAVNLGIRVSKREYANQSKTMYLGHDAIEVEDVPDLIFCTTNATRIRGSLPKGYCRSVNSLKTPTISPGYYLHSPCDENHDTMFIFWTDQGKIKLNGIDGLVKVFEFESNDTEDIKFVLLPSEDDTYRALKVLPLAVKQNHPMIYNELFNVHYARPNQTIAYMSYNVQITRSLRSDFWGLFNTRNQKLDKNVETHVEEYIYSPGETRFHLKIPYSWKESKQVLLLSIPDALAAWGGAFSFVFPIFFILFGNVRHAPIGIIQTWFMKHSTKRKIRESNYHPGTPDTCEDANNGPSTPTCSSSSSSSTGQGASQVDDLQKVVEHLRDRLECFELHFKDCCANMDLVEEVRDGSLGNDGTTRSKGRMRPSKDKVWRSQEKGKAKDIPSTPTCSSSSSSAGQGTSQGTSQVDDLQKEVERLRDRLEWFELHLKDCCANMDLVDEVRDESLGNDGTTRSKGRMRPSKDKVWRSQEKGKAKDIPNTPTCSSSSSSGQGTSQGISQGTSQGASQGTIRGTNQGTSQDNALQWEVEPHRGTLGRVERSEWRRQLEAHSQDDCLEMDLAHEVRDESLGIDRTTESRSRMRRFKDKVWIRKRREKEKDMA